MPDSTAAGIITASAAVFTSLALVITAVAGLVAARRVGRQVGQVETKVDSVHTMVNQQRTDALNYQRALISALNRAGIEVPADQSVDPGSAPST